jgi:glycosyltransferase involved in cell wall biosynthesis
LTPQVSIIVPNYNHAKYLSARMECILNQTFQDFEVIILDDCSTDNSWTIIESYRNCEKVSHILYNAVNSGSPFVQWNRGVNLASGSFIWIAEPDDCCKENFLGETVTKMKDFPTVGLVYTQSMEKDDGSGAESPVFRDSTGFTQSFQNSYFDNGRREMREKFVLEQSIPYASGILFRKSVFDWIGGADKSMLLCGDWFLWLKILFVSDVYFIAEPLNIYRLTNVSVRSRFSGIHTFHERMRIIYWMHWRGVKRMGIKELILLENLFNSFMLKKLDKPVKLILSDPVMNNKLIKIAVAFTISIYDRLRGHISRLSHRLTTTRHGMATQ